MFFVKFRMQRHLQWSAVNACHDLLPCGINVTDTFQIYARARALPLPQAAEVQQHNSCPSLNIYDVNHPPSACQTVLITTKHFPVIAAHVCQMYPLHQHLAVTNCHSRTVSISHGGYQARSTHLELASSSFVWSGVGIRQYRYWYSLEEVEDTATLVQYSSCQNRQLQFF